MRALLIAPEGDAQAFARAMASGADAVVADVAEWRGPGPALYFRVPEGALAEAARCGPAGFAMASEGGADVQRLGARLAVAEARLGLAEGGLRILAFATETPRGVLGLASYRGASQRLAGLVVTRAALARALRATPDGSPVRHARDMALIAARAAGVPVFEAIEGADVRAQAQAARADGFDGMAARTPEELAIIRAAFAI